jgi:hypothetical protein
MRTLLLGLASIAAVAAVTPASAQGFYFGAPGVSVGVGAPAYRERSYDYGPRYRAHRYYGDDAYAYAPRGCRTITIQRDDGSVRRIRRCG